MTRELPSCDAQSDVLSVTRSLRPGTSALPPITASQATLAERTNGWAFMNTVWKWRSRST